MDDVRRQLLADIIAVMENDDNDKDFLEDLLLELQERM